MSDNPWVEVYEALMDMPITNGRYDARHGDRHFMNGVSFVMEQIAHEADMVGDYEKRFLGNLFDSENEADRTCDGCAVPALQMDSCEQCSRNYEDLYIEEAGE